MNRKPAEAGPVVVLDARLEADPPSETRVVVYRIVAEALANARKHAHASRVEISVESKDGGVLVRIHDDGVGFSAEDVAVDQPGHMGLTSMRERAELVGGRWRASSTPGNGTTVEFWVPAGETDPPEASGGDASRG